MLHGSGHGITLSMGWYVYCVYDVYKENYGKGGSQFSIIVHIFIAFECYHEL